jgi:hypothetical protein
MKSFQFKKEYKVAITKVNTQGLERTTSRFHLFIIALIAAKIERWFHCADSIIITKRKQGWIYKEF